MKNQNLHIKQYRYKLFEKKSNNKPEVVMDSSGQKEQSRLYTSGKPERFYVPYEYKFYCLLKFWWKFLDWHKRPRVKKKQSPIISNVLNFFKKFLYEIIIAFIVGFCFLIWGTEIKELYAKIMAAL